MFMAGHQPTSSLQAHEIAGLISPDIADLLAPFFGGRPDASDKVALGPTRSPAPTATARELEDA